MKHCALLVDPFGLLDILIIVIVEAIADSALKAFQQFILHGFLVGRAQGNKQGIKRLEGRCLQWLLRRRLLNLAGQLRTTKGRSRSGRA